VRDQVLVGVSTVVEELDWAETTATRAPTRMEVEKRMIAEEL
jgi:hypothetical protein